MQKDAARAGSGAHRSPARPWAPISGLTTIDKSSFDVEGQVASVNEPVVHIRVAKIDKASGAVSELAEQTLLLREDKFSGPVALNDGPGLYRFKAIAAPAYHHLPVVVTKCSTNLNVFR